MRSPVRIATSALAVVAASALAGCVPSIPADPDGALDRIREDGLRVGVTESPGWVQLVEGEDPAGAEIDLVAGFAESLGVGITWRQESEQRLVEELDAGAVDLVVGGIRPDTPWSDRASTTQAYVLDDARGERREELVMLAPLGENGLVLELDRYLQEHDDAR